MSFWERHKWKIGWFLWLGLFVTLEGAALANREPGDTLTEHVKVWFSVNDKSWGWRWRRVGLFLFTSWLVAHFNSRDKKRDE